jgi:hypothetical protein
MTDANGGPGSKRDRHATPGFSAARGAALVAVAVIVGIVLLQAIDDGNSGPIGDGGAGSKVTSTSTTTPAGTGGSSTTSVTTAKPTVAPPAETTVEVQNGSGQQGVATTLTNTLKAKGYKTLPATNAAVRKGTVVYYRAGKNAECKGVQASVPNSTLAAMPTPPPGGVDADCIVIVGS